MHDPTDHDHLLSTALLSGLEREVFDGSPLGVVERDLDNRVRYANRAALDMMGATHYEGLNLADVFEGDAAQQLLATQTAERRQRLLGNYRVTLTRLDDRTRKVDVEITGVPLLDRHGAVVGSLGLFRSLEQQRLTEDIRDLTLQGGSGHDLLRGVAEKVRRVLPFDLMLVSRINPEGGEFEIYFSHPPFEQDVPTVWVAMDAGMVQYLADNAGGRVDYERVLSEPPWNRMDHEPMVRQLRGMNLKTSMWRRVRREEHGQLRLVGSITLLSRRADAYDAADEKLFQELPLIEAVLRALDDEQRRFESRRLQLFRDLSACRNADEACVRLASALVGMFDWAGVCLYRVEGGFDRIRRVACARKAAGGAPTIELPGPWDDRDRPIDDRGVLGRVVWKRLSENIGDLEAESGVPGARLVVPIVFDQEERARFVIQAEDPRIDAFSSEHQSLLEEIAREVAGAMQRITEVAFLSECFANASDPIIATDAKLRIRRVNPAAASLFGFATPAAVQGRITDFFEDAAPFEALLPDRPDRPDRREKLGELTVRRTGDEVPPQAYVTRKDFPDSLGGHVFIARDLRDIRRAVQLEFLEQAAYEIAVETKAPLDLATAFLERLQAGREATEPLELQKVLRQLGRVKRSYTRLAMYNRAARLGGRRVSVVNLGAELQALRATLAGSDAAKLVLPDEGTAADVAVAMAANVEADHTEVAIVLETLVASLLRAAPEAGRVRMGLVDDGTDIVLRLRGKLSAERRGAGPVPFSASAASASVASASAASPSAASPLSSDAAAPLGGDTARIDLRRADPLLRTLMKQQGGSLVVADADGDTVFELRFPRRVAR